MFYAFNSRWGGKSINDFRQLLKYGADKVCVNTAAVENPTLITQAAEKFGSQCVVVSIDVKRINSNYYRVFTHSGKQNTGLEPVEFAKKVESNGAGEILLTSIDNDGSMRGYDITISKKVSEAVKIPIIASGGAGIYQHMVEILTNTKVSAISAASIFHFTEQTPLEAKENLAKKGINVRLFKPLQNVSPS